MSAAPIPSNERQRLEALARYNILDTLPEAEYDDLTALAASICGAPISLVSFVDADRQWFKSHIGVDSPHTPQTARADSFCAHTLECEGVFEVPDAAQDAHFQDNIFVTGPPQIRFYAGAPLITSDHFHLGTLCVLDRAPRHLSSEQKHALQALARQVVSQLELRRALAQARAADEQKALALEEKSRALAQLGQAHARLHDEVEARIEAQEQLRASEASFRSLAESSPDLICAFGSNERLSYASSSSRLLLGFEPGELIGLSACDLFYCDDFERNQPLQTWLTSASGKAHILRALRKDGSWVWLEVMGQAIVHPETGDVLQFHTTARDVSARLRDETRRQNLLDGLNSIVRVADGLIEARTPDELLRQCIERAHLDLRYSSAQIFLYDAPADQLRGAYGVDASGQARSIADLRRDLWPQLRAPHQNTSSERSVARENVGVASDENLMVFPLGTGERLLGALWLGEREGDDSAVGAELGAVLASLFSTLLERTRAEERARQSQKLLSTVVDNAPLILYAVDQDEKVTLSVGRGLRSVGFDDQTMVGQTLAQVIGEDSPSTLSVRAALRGEVVDGPWRLAGQEFDAFRRPMHDENGDISGMVGVLVNVTDRARVQGELQRSEARYRSVVDSVSEVIFQADSNSNWTFLNAAWQEITGWSAEESLGRNALEFIHLEDHESVRQYSHSLISDPGSDRRMTARYLTRNGEVRWMEVFVRPSFDESGDFVGVSGTLADISERFLAERALRETTEMQRAILGGASYAIWSCDATGILRTFNRAAEAMFLLPSPAACGLVRAPLLVASEDLRARAQELEREQKREVSLWEALTWPALQTGRDEREWTGVRSDGTRFPMRLSLSPLRDESGQVEGFVAIGSDLSDAKRAEKLKTEFVSVVSHELRTPLTSIRGALGLVEAGVAGEIPPKAAQMISIAHKNAERLVLLINDILDIEKIEGGQMRFESAPVEINQLVGQSLQANAPYAQNLGVELEFDGPSTPLWVQGDEARLLQVMANLLSNAAKFTPHGGRVRVETRLVPAPDVPGKMSVEVDVFDGGDGVPVEFESRLFERFAQADSSATRARGGTGLGLSISHAIIEQQGGILSYHAATPTTRHSFRFVLPGWKEETIDAPRPRLLVCEDDPEIADFLSCVLSEQGFSVALASTLAQARTALESEHFDALTLDLLLPDGDGIAFLSELRQRGERLPVVVVSAHCEEDCVRGGGALDVLDWLQKPLDPARLLAALGNLKCDSNRRVRVLHVEDDADVREVTRAILGERVEVVQAATLEEAREKLAGARFDLALLDIALPDGDGLELVPLLASQSPPVPVALFSAQEAQGPRGREVAAALVKSRSTNADLRGVIERLLHLAPDSLSSISGVG